MTSELTLPQIEGLLVNIGYRRECERKQTDAECRAASGHASGSRYSSGRHTMRVSAGTPFTGTVRMSPAEAVRYIAEREAERSNGG